MYSMVLMMAMNTSADVPDFGRRGGGCCGCCGGCYGGGWGGCYGGCYGGCWGGGYGGCYGSYARWGGCYGGGWGGCYGGGCGGGYGGCYGGGWAGCSGGGWGGCYGGMGGFAYGGSGLGSGGYIVSAPAVTPAYSGTPLMQTDAVDNAGMQPALDTNQSMYYNPGNASGERPATVIVHVPENAKLFIDDKPSQKRAATRRFQTPPLPAGQDYHYTLRAEIDRDGQRVSTSKTVTVRAGRPTEVTLAFPND